MQIPHSHQPPLARRLCFVGCALVLLCFYLLIPGYGPGREQSLLQVLYDSWNEETRYEHGVMFPFIILGLLVHQWKNIRGSVQQGEWQGLLLLGLGCLLFIAAHRVIQWRVGVGSLPFIVSGLIWYLCGRRTFLLTCFPVFYLWLSIPIPDIQQATVPLQNISISLAQSICNICGVQTYASGAVIYSTAQKWNPLTVDEMCSGIRSLMALLMISCAWAYLAPMKLWKRSLLIVSALPIAILGNGLRVASIFVIAEYGNPQFAQKTWHDHSGLLLFYPISLLLMMGLHTILEGGFPWKQRTIRRTIVRTTNTPATPTP
ncbi:MAG: exosortase/archaeosortase family protein [Akkermansiaceae bacterium]